MNCKQVLRTDLSLSISSITLENNCLFGELAWSASAILKSSNFIIVVRLSIIKSLRLQIVSRFLFTGFCLLEDITDFVPGLMVWTEILPVINFLWSLFVTNAVSALGEVSYLHGDGVAGGTREPFDRDELLWTNVRLKTMRYFKKLSEKRLSLFAITVLGLLPSTIMDSVWSGSSLGTKWLGERLLLSIACLKASDRKVCHL